MPWVGAELEASGAGPGAKSGIIFVPPLVAPGPGLTRPSVPSSSSWQAPEGLWGALGERQGDPSPRCCWLTQLHTLLAAGRGCVEALSRPWAETGGEARHPASWARNSRPHRAGSSSILVTDPRSRTSGDPLPCSPQGGPSAGPRQTCLVGQRLGPPPSLGKEAPWDHSPCSARGTRDIREVEAPSCHLLTFWPPRHLLCLVFNPRRKPRHSQETQRLRYSTLLTCQFNYYWDFPGGSVVKNLPAKRETRVRSLGQEDPLEKGMATQNPL